VPGTDLGPLFASIRPGGRTGCLAPIWAPCLLASDLAPHRVPGTDLGPWHRFGPLFASIQPGSAPGAWHRFGPLFASIRPGVAPGAWHRFGPLFASIRPGRRTGCLAPIWAPCLLASDRASHQVPGTHLGSLFASIRHGVAPGAWHRFAALSGLTEIMTSPNPRAALRFALGYPLAPRWGIKPSGKRHPE
jgi:hypothetical protein